LMDQEVYRHIRFKNKDSSNYWFDLITTPHCLTIRGDMGSWSFTRLEDMFQFFRTDGNKPNYQYWAEKCESVDRHSKIEQFSVEKFNNALLERAHEFIENNVFSNEEKKVFLEELQNEVVLQGFEGENDLIHRHDWEYVFEDGSKFDIHEWLSSGDDTFNELSSRYIWICNAIMWGIQQYDQYKLTFENTKKSKMTP